MGQVYLLGTKKTYDTSKQVLSENQIVTGYGYGMNKESYVVYKVENKCNSFIYHMINIETKEFTQTDLPRPLSEKFGIGMYYNDRTPELMDSFEVAILISEAKLKADKQRAEKEILRERNEQLKAIGKERLQMLIPSGTKAVIVAELHEDDSDSMTDYFGYHTARTVILGFSPHTKDIFAEMRKYAVNFEETVHLAEENEKYEHREKYTGGAGYYLGKNRYSGWVVKKEKFYKDRESIIEAFAHIAGEESNIYVKTKSATDETSTAITGDFFIVDYSQKALAVFGDTRPVKNQLKASGGRFNPKLMHNGTKKAGWIFSKSKEQEIKKLLNIQ